MATSVRLSKDTKERLAVLSKRTGYSKAHHIREFVEKGLPKLENKYKEKTNEY